MSPREMNPIQRRAHLRTRRAEIEALLATVEQTRQRDLAAALAQCREAERQAGLIGDPALGAKALTLRAVCHLERDETAESLACSRQALARFVEAGDAAGQARALAMSGNVCLSTGRHAEALRLYRRGLAQQARAGLPTHRLVRCVGTALHHLGECAEARRDFATALAGAHAADDALWAGLIEMDLGNCHGSAGDFATAPPHFERGLALHRANGYPIHVAYALANLAQCDLERGRLEAALARIAEAGALGRKAGLERPRTQLLLVRAGVHAARGNRAAAIADCKAALRLALRAGDRGGQAWALAERATLERAAGKGEAAERRFAAAEALARESGEKPLLAKIRARRMTP